MSEPNEKSGVSGVVSAVTSLKPGIAILKFWQGIVDLVLRAIVVVLSIIVLIAGSVAANDIGLQVLSFHHIGGWAAFVGFLMMVVEVGFIIFRFLNFAVTFQKPLVVFIVDLIVIGFGIGGIGISFIVSAVHTGDINLIVNILQSSKSSIGALCAFCALATVSMIALLVFSILWFVLKWYRRLEDLYSPGSAEEE